MADLAGIPAEGQGCYPTRLTLPPIFRRHKRVTLLAATGGISLAASGTSCPRGPCLGGCLGDFLISYGPKYGRRCLDSWGLRNRLGGGALKLHALSFHVHLHRKGRCRLQSDHPLWRLSATRTRTGSLSASPISFRLTCAHLSRGGYLGRADMDL